MDSIVQSVFLVDMRLFFGSQKVTNTLLIWMRCVSLKNILPKKYFKGPNVGKYSSNPKGKDPSDVWNIPNVKSNHVEKTCHPCQFPVALVQRLVLAFSNEQDIVFDPFLGVGSTAVAGVINKRKIAGSETVDKYYDIACERVNLAYENRLKIRPDKPIYEPPGNLSLAKNPFVTETEGRTWK